VPKLGYIKSLKGLGLTMGEGLLSAPTSLTDSPGTESEEFFQLFLNDFLVLLQGND
jgi:hypothetical protein